MKKIRIRNTDKAMGLRVLILNLILQKKFKESRDLAEKYETPIGYDMINFYNEDKNKYDKLNQKSTKNERHINKNRK